MEYARDGKAPKGPQERRIGASCRPLGTSWDVSNRLPWADAHGYNMSPLRGCFQPFVAVFICPRKLPLTCERCKLPMTRIASGDRPSWREIFEVAIYREPIYSPVCHLLFGERPAAHPIEGYG